MFPKELVRLTPTNGIWVPASNIKDPDVATQEGVLKAVTKLKPVKFSDSDSRFAILPFMPCILPTLIKVPDVIEKNAPIKCPGPVQGYRSGARSAIVPVSESKSPDDWIIAEVDGVKYTPNFDAREKLFRLKGCGMWIQENNLSFPGITFQDAESMHADEGQVLIDIRGVSFENTSMTEMYTLRHLQPLFDAMKVRLGNAPIGYWMYKNLENDPAPLVQKTVSVMETIGDRRLETNLLTGLEFEIVNLFSEDIYKSTIEKVTKLFSENGMARPSNENRTYTRFSNLSCKNVAQAIMDLRGNLSEARIEGITPEDIRKVGFLPNSAIIEVFHDDLKPLAKFYASLGWEAGRAIAGIHRSGFLWGTFQDHNPGELHCNAHTDNLVVLDRKTGMNPDGSFQMLAPVDFDMSFRPEQALNFWENPPQPDPEMAYNHYNTEFQAFLQDLGGMTALVPGVCSAIEARPQPPGVFDDILWVLRDVTLSEAIASYLCPQRPRPFDISIDEAYKFIDVALAATIDKCS